MRKQPAPVLEAGADGGPGIATDRVRLTADGASVAIREDWRSAEPLADLGTRAGLTFDLRAGSSHVWVVARHGRDDLVALRHGFGGAIQGQPAVAEIPGARVCEWRTTLGAARLKIVFPVSGKAVARCTLSLLPVDDVRWSASCRDLYFADGSAGEIQTMQRGLRTGIFFATCTRPAAYAALYLQDFSSLNEFFDTVRLSPSGTVGGTLAEAGYMPPCGPDCTLPKARELVLSDAYLALEPDRANDPDHPAGRYLDLLAEVYASMPRPSVDYRDWPERATRTLRDLSLSPACTYERNGRRYLAPYVGDTSKPPESMVQFTLLLNTLEYDHWRGAKSGLAQMLLAAVPSFFDAHVGSVVRWLPGESFGDQSEEHMDHRSMDSWYFYHALFNLSRLAANDNTPAREALLRSLPFAIRVARRFDYRWPIFFDLETLDIVRAESAPGKGGENDVAGLYALVMLHAHELFGDAAYLEEAERAVAGLRDLGFGLGYQMNTTGFAAEAALRLWRLTRNREYLDLSEICMANLFDNMWLWRCAYGFARHYRTFFGLFPLHDAPYLAPYEELEAQAKFHAYLALGGTDVRPSLRYLLAEYQKYSLDRAWFYFPDALPTEVLAKAPRNGSIERALSVPLEDLQDGLTECGQVGQEVYGAGLAFVYSSRHYVRLPQVNALLYCEYPCYDVTVRSRGKAAVMTLRTGGHRRGCCGLRLIPLDADAPQPRAEAAVAGARKPLAQHLTVEGHIAFELEGDRIYDVRVTSSEKSAQTGTTKRRSRVGRAS